MGIEQRDDQPRVDPGRRPRAGQRAVEADPGQDVEPDAALELQPRDDVEAVELDEPLPDVGQVPTGCRRRPPDAALRIEGPSTLEDAGDRPDRRRPLGIESSLQLATDRQGSVLAEDALFAQLAPDLEDEILDLGSRSADAGRDRRSIPPVDLVERPVGGTPQGTLDGPQPGSQPPGDRSLRLAGANRRDDLSPLPRGALEPIPLPMSPAPHPPFSISVLTRRRWHGSDPQAVASGLQGVVEVDAEPLCVVGKDPEELAQHHLPELLKSLNVHGVHTQDDRRMRPRACANHPQRGNRRTGPSPPVSDRAIRGRREPLCTAGCAL